MKTITNIWNFFIASRFVKKPLKPFTWTVEDFRKAKRWAKTQRDPENTKRSLWDRYYSVRQESTEVLHNINQYI